MAARVLPALALSSRHKALRRDGFPLHRGQRFLLWPQLVPSDKLSVPLAAAGWLGPRSVDVTAGESRVSFRASAAHFGTNHCTRTALQSGFLLNPSAVGGFTCAACILASGAVDLLCSFADG